jgi:hypothetical protein
MIDPKDRKALDNREVIPEREVYRVKDFCHKYAISRTSFYREIWSKRLNVVKRGRLTFITRSEAERWFHGLGYFKTKETMEKRYSAALKST